MSMTLNVKIVIEGKVKVKKFNNKAILHKKTP